MALSVGRVGSEFLPGSLYTRIGGDSLADLSEFNGMNVYGVRYHPERTKAMPVCKSRDMIWKPASPDGPGIDDYKDVAPFNVRKCFTTYKDFMPFKRMILAYEGEDRARFGDLNYAQLKAANGAIGDGNFANRMVEFPRGYFYCPDKYTVLVSPTKIDERWSISPAHDLGVENTVVAEGQVSSVCCSEFRLSTHPDTGDIVSMANQTFESKTCREWRTSLPEGMYPISLGFYNWFIILAAIKHNSFNFLKSVALPNETSVTNEDNIQGLDGRSNSDLNIPGRIRMFGIQDAYSLSHVFLSNAIMLIPSASGSNHPFIYCKQDVTNVETVLNSSTILSDPKWKQIGTLPITGQAYLYKPNFLNSKQSFFIPTEEDEGAYLLDAGDRNPNAAFAGLVYGYENSAETVDKPSDIRVLSGGTESYTWYYCHPNDTSTDCLGMEFMK